MGMPMWGRNCIRVSMPEDSGGKRAWKNVESKTLIGMYFRPEGHRQRFGIVSTQKAYLIRGN